MRAILDTDEVNSYVEGFGPRMVVNQAAVPLHLILEPAYGYYYAFSAGRGVSVYAAPRLIGTAAVGVNPWDHIFGPINTGFQNVPAQRLQPQTSPESMV